MKGIEVPDRDVTSADTADAIVIGAGIIGSSIALELARGGRCVIVVDKGSGAGAGSTSASSAIIRYSYSTSDSVLTAWEAAQLWRDWEAHLGVVDPDGMCRFFETGSLILLTTGYDGTDLLPLWDDIGVPYTALDPSALAERFGFLDTGKYYPPKRVDDPALGDEPDGRLAAIYNPDSGFIDDPMLAARNLAHAAQQHGAQFRYRSEVGAIERDEGGVRGVQLVNAGNGDDVAAHQLIEAPIVINAAGPHSSGINRLAGVTDDMSIRHRPLRQEVFVVPAPPGAALEDGAPFVADLDVGQYFRPQPGGSLLAGGTEPECDELHWVDDPDTNSEHTTVEVWETQMMRLARRLPEFGVPTQPRGLAALYDVADDWVPIYDRSSLHGFFMACGTSGNQFKNGPLVGQFLRDIIDATMSGHDHDADPVRFRGAFTGREINLGAFSRRRDRADTSGTVMG
ncbi:MAG: FAD-dependent oxidoreductase [Actinomycetota bacterium]|nr:FAD-dependent oxidoreductase [Actinomycetota bacterium]